MPPIKRAAQAAAPKKVLSKADQVRVNQNAIESKKLEENGLLLGHKQSMRTESDLSADPSKWMGQFSAYAAQAAAHLDIDFLTPELGESWRKVKIETEKKIKESLVRGAGVFGGLAGSAEHLIHLTAESEFLSRVIANIRRDWKDAVMKAAFVLPDPEWRATETKLEMHSQLWLEPASTITEPLTWFDKPREIYITFPFYN